MAMFLSRGYKLSNFGTSLSDLGIEMRKCVTNIIKSKYVCTKEKYSHLGQILRCIPVTTHCHDKSEEIETVTEKKLTAEMPSQQ